MKTRSAYIADTVRILKAVRNDKKKYKIMLLGKEFVVYPDVFSPKYFQDTGFFAENLPIRKNEEFLEIGCGTGICTLFALWKGAKKAVATDINPAAVRNTRENAVIHGLQDRITVLKGDIFTPLKKEKFNTIFWSVPFVHTRKRNLTMLERSCFDPEYESLKRFLAHAKSHMKPKGRILMGFSTDIGDFAKLKKLAKSAGFRINLLKEKISGQSKLADACVVSYQLFQLDPR